MAEENKNQKFRYVRREGAPGLGLLNDQGKGAGLGKLRDQGAGGLGIRAQLDPMIEGLGNRLENRLLRIRTRMQTLGVGNMQPQPEKDLQKQVYFCPECNSEVQETQKFCSSCSTPLTADAKKELKHKESLRLMSSMSIENF